MEVNASGGVHPQEMRGGESSAIQRVWKFALRVLDGIPVLNTGFWTAGSKAHADAFKEFILVFVIALMPFWLGAFMTLATGYDQPNVSQAGWYELLVRSQYARGQLFLAAAGALGTLFWLSLKEYKAGQFPDRIWFVLISLIVAVAAAAIYGLEYAYGPAAKERLPSTFLIPFSEGAMAMTLLLYYAGSVLNNSLLSMQPQDEMRRRDDDFSERYKSHR